MASTGNATFTVKAMPGTRVLVVEARFYDGFADALLDGAKKALAEAAVDFDVLKVRGSLEIPSMIAIALDAAAAAGRPYDAAIALGTVVRGETSHYDLVSEQSCRGLMDISIARKFPIGNGIITVEDEGQAWERVLPEKQDKGGGAVRAALTVLAISRELEQVRR